jgi:aryl-alcohol dehydrogenase-like predicted oxidoreductase
MNANQIVLGSANFGLQYGVKNQIKLPKSEVEKILKTCRLTGIATIDTAIGYGESQRVLGELGCDDFHFVTKLPGLPPQESDVLNWVRSQVSRALADLKQEKLYGLLLHRPGDLLGKNGQGLARALSVALREFGIEKLGISVYEPKELIDCWQVLHYDIVQIPCNVFDQRFTSGPAFAHLEAHDIEVHARSVFLQGLLLMQVNNRPNYFKPWAHVFQAWADLIERSQKTALEICMAFATQQHFIHKWVIGVDSAAQLLGVVSATESNNVRLNNSAWVPFRDLPLDLISPARWSSQ